MSDADGGDGAGGDPGPGTREVAYRLFAAEFDDADLEHAESDEERAPNYVVTPTGLRVNRLFAVGVLTETERVNEQTLRGRVVDPTGAFVTYAGQYQPDESAFLDRAEPPAFVALTGKARTFSPEDADVVYTSVRPESLATADAETRDRWVVSAAEATLERVAVFARALASPHRGADLRERLASAGVPAAVAAGVPLALDHYDTGERYLAAVRRLATDALEVVADEREEVRPLETDPDERGETEIGPLPELPYDLETALAGEPGAEPAAKAEAAGATDEADALDADESAGDGTTVDVDTGTEPGVETGTESASDVEADTGTASDADAGATTSTADDAAASTESGTSTEPAREAEPEPDTSTEPVASTATTSETDATAAAEEVSDDPSDFDAGGADTSDLDDMDGLGDFDAGGDLGEEEPEDPLSEEERREVEAEHGVEFATGSEVPEPGESDIDAPDPEAATPDADADPGETGTAEGGDSGAAADSAASSSDTAATESAEPTDEHADEPATADAEPAGDEAVDDSESDTDEPAESAEDVDLEDAVVELMEELDDGDGADREAVLAAAVDRYGVDPDEVADAVQDALMDGRCYEPADGTLKSI